MHTLKINVEDSALDKVLYFLKNLPSNEVQILEESVTQGSNKECIDFSKYPISSFKAIKDPLEWQRKMRSEWGRVE